MEAELPQNISRLCMLASERKQQSLAYCHGSDVTGLLLNVRKLPDCTRRRSLILRILWTAQYDGVLYRGHRDFMKCNFWAAHICVKTQAENEKYCWYIAQFKTIYPSSDKTVDRTFGASQCFPSQRNGGHRFPKGTPRCFHTTYPPIQHTSSAPQLSVNATERPVQRTWGARAMKSQIKKRWKN